MTSKQPSCFSSFLKGFVKFFTVYYIFGSAALFIMCMSLGIIEYMETGSSVLLNIGGEDDLKVVLQSLISGTIDSVPFGELFELLLDDGNGILSALIEFFKNFKDTDFSFIWKTYAPELFRDLTVSSLASLFFFILTRINKIFSKYNSFALSAAFAVVSVLWLFAAYSASECIIKILETMVKSERFNILYSIIFVVSFGIHTVSLAFSAKSNVLRIFIVFGIQILFDALRAIFTWFLGGYLSGLFDIANAGRSITVFLIVAFFLCFLEIIEKDAINKATFPLFMQFLKRGKRF